MSSPSVAVIDIGSNSIKLLVAERSAGGGQIRALQSRTLETRISAGISSVQPLLSDEGMRRGLEAIRTLLEDADAFTPRETVLVATSAVRDALNGDVFRAQVSAITGHFIRLLTGNEEANFIGRGLTCDPALSDLQDFYVFDLGGGSMECLRFSARQVQQAVSLQLGCVRLTEKFVAQPTLPLPEKSRALIADHTRSILHESGFNFSLPSGAVAVGTGGTITTVRAVIGAQANTSFDQTDVRISIGQLRNLLRTVSSLSLEERKSIAGLPAARADIFPAALTTMIAVAEVGGLDGFRNSLYNLRWGIAAETLAKIA